MKFLPITFVLIFLMPFGLAAQEISILPDTIIKGTAEMNDLNDYWIHIVNDSDTMLELSWRVVDVTVPEEWELATCDDFACGPLTVGSIFVPLASGDTTFFILDVNPLEIEGSGIVQFWIHETYGDMFEAHKTVTFEIETEGFNAIAEVLDFDFEIFPNPVSDYLQVENPYDFPIELSFLSLNGITMKSEDLNPNSYQNILVNDLPKGTCIIQFQKEQEILKSHKLIVN